MKFLFALRSLSTLVPCDKETAMKNGRREDLSSQRSQSVADGSGVLEMW